MPVALTAIENKDLVVNAVQAAMAGRVDELVSVLHPDLELYEPDYLPYAGIYRGPDGFKALLDVATKVLDLTSLQISSATADDERVVLLMTAKLVQTGDEMILTEHWRIQDSKIREVRVFWFGLPPSS